ncbi:uncharacterized protein MONOS_3988 [Monocercomonoides exilis]|uniref:uncharacterized protein n=1 Tax=Monocercomonoides exilis TaxID=2049356 RepID=UPI00355A4F04|nr:hypothetical protein MONOS_3988 [Monocercomonoides exilis]|eukprot:MONOS_3988.1-p1 / transcript=MONOS_3988.1 / gene=MONOS_3988 / organism=Monocercomonoides_exilis_PA203 / gene_product=unspecified product / transcript_product=unspecified product / location=Mono_scaffold00100:29866-39075(+) / protein_length=3069 / sequence_SO=supercontig / SO=protein_coding / is_pseudo=false
MVLGLSGIFYCLWIICVECMCNGATSDGAVFREESVKVENMNYPEGIWPEKAENSKYGNGILYDTYIEGKEGRVGETEKQERMIKNYTKQWNDGRGEIEKIQKWSFCDEWKMRGKERMCGGSGVEGSVVLVNSSMKLNSLGLRERDGESVLRASDGCFVELSGCVVGVERETPPFDFCGSCGLFANISLRSSSTGFLQSFPSLFSSKALEGKFLEKCHVFICSSHFSSFHISSAPFLSSPSIPHVSLSQLTFFNISTANEACSTPTTTSTQTSCLMSSCSFSSVCDAYDGGVVPSLNNPFASLNASNTSFVRCCRTKNVVCEGTSDNRLAPGRQNETFNGANSFIWCEWNGSKATGNKDDYTDDASNGGAIRMCYLNSGELSVSHCSFNDCYAHYAGGGVMCRSIKSIEFVSNSFNACSSQSYFGGGIYAVLISTCVRISGCEFQKCKAYRVGGGLYLDDFYISGSSCIGTENGKGESACVFECSFTSCSLTNSGGGGMYCQNVPTAFKMRSIQFISCSALTKGGGLYMEPNKQVAPNETIYCLFFFFHECKCLANVPYGNDMTFSDYYNSFLNSGNPFYECYTTNSDEQRMCYAYDYANSGSWSHQHMEKKDWLNDKTLYVSVNGNDSYVLCGANFTNPCETVKKALEMCEIQISLAITLMDGNHKSETTTIEIGTKKISVIGMGKEKSVIEMKSLSSSSARALFSVTTGHLGMSHLKVDCNSTAEISPSVVVVSDGSGSLSLEDVVIIRSKTGDYVMSSSVFVVPLSQLSMVDVEIINMNVSKSLFSEPNQSSPSSSSSLSSSALYLTATASGDSVLANVKVKNVKLTEGDGVVVSKNVKEGETFIVQNVTIQDCECKAGSGGGIKVDLLYSTSKLRVGTSSAPANEATKFNRCNCSGNGGGIMVNLADGSHDFSILSVDFSGCTASLSGNYVFVNGSNSVSWGITTEKLNAQHDSSKYNELMGYDRSDSAMGLFPLNVFLDTFPNAAHVGKVKDGLGGYNSWFCGFAYYPCATITHAAQVRYSGTNKKIELDSGFEFSEDVAMTDGHEWEISCSTKGMEMGVKAPENFESSCLIEVLNKCSIRNIKFCIPSALSGASSLILSNSTLFTLTDCSVICSSDNLIGYCFVNVIGGKVKVEGLVITETLTFGEHSLIEFVEGVESVVFCGCNVNNIEKRNGDGGWLSGVVGTERGEGKNGIIVIESCDVKECSCLCGRGGGICVRVKGEGSVVVNGSCVFEGCEAMNSNGSEGRGGGIMIVMESRDGSMKMESGREGLFVFGENNKAEYGKDVFVHCGSGVLLESKVNGSSFEFFDSCVIPTDVVKLCGSEDGREGEVIPLFVYLCSIGTKLRVDGSGERALDHSHCGFEEFGCLTIDYCVEKRASSNVNEIEVVSESWIKNEMKVASFDLSVSGKEEGMRVTVMDEGSMNQNSLIECTKSFEMRHLSFVLNEGMNGRRSAFIHSSSAIIIITSCSVSFGNDELIGFNVICIEGGGMVVNGFVMEGGVRMNGKSPIVVSNGVELEMNNSRMNGAVVTGGIGGGGCLNVEMGVNGIVNIEECNLSSVCSGGSGMKGGGMMISVGKGGSLEMKNVKYSGCEVPTEDVENGGRGMGGGMFVKLPDEMVTFVMEGMSCEGCDAWKGKNVFVSGWDLREIVNEEHLKWEMSSEELRSLDELCGWERKTTGEEGYVIPLVVYLWRNWSGNGFVSREKGGDFSGCGFSEAPCSSIDHLISLRYEPLGEGETHIAIVGSGLLSHSISFSFSSSSISDSPKVVIEGTKKGTGMTISDEDENDLDDRSMISSNVSLSFVNVSFTKPAITTHHEVLIESSGTNTLLSVSDCSFGSLTGLTETAGYCLMRVNEGSVVIERCSLSLISELKGLIVFSPGASEVTVQNVNISFVSVIERSLISMIDENQMNGDENTGSNSNRPVLRVVGSSFTNITNEGNEASVIGVGSYEHGMECVIDECSMLSCKSGLSREGGGMKVVLKSGESLLKVNGSSFSMCKCSSETGCGGGLFIDGSDPNANYGNESQIPPLKFKIVNVLFYMNEASVGKDIFVRCHSIEHQINETLFALNYNQKSLNSNNSICGRGVESEGDVDLIPLITYFYGLQVFVNATGTDGRRCGAQSNPCLSINCGVDHIQEGVMNAILIDGEGFVTEECVIGDLVVNSLKKTQAVVRLNLKIEKSFEKDCVMEFINESTVERCSFQFEDTFEASHRFILKVNNGMTKIQECEFFSSADEVQLNSSIVSVESGELKISETIIRDIHSTRSVLLFCEESNVIIDETSILNIKCEGDVVSAGGKAKVAMKEMSVENVTVLLEGCAIGMDDAEQEVSVLNCSFGKCVNSVDKGIMMQIRQSKGVRIENCVFDGEKEDEIIDEGVERKKEEGLCKWNGSLVDVKNSNVEMKETTIMKSKEGGLWVSGGSVKIEKGEFENNNPSIEGYPSARRNVICEGNSELNVVSVKGGDGLKDNSSLWILDEGCQLGGIASERGSSFFIPILEEVKNSTQLNGNLDLIISGKLLLPCDLSVKMSMKNGDEEEIVRKEIDEKGFVSENEIHTFISSSELEKVREETEVSVCIVFGKANSPLSTEPFIVKNRSESQSSGNEKLVEGRKEGKPSWALVIAVIFVVLFLIVLIVSIIVTVRWRKAKNENKDLREIVNDTVRKDPKLIEMVTMEMSPEEQWRRAEREAEKKNEERIKKRIFDSNMEHSESSEHLLSESGSTEYILGRDSDKIPEWALEKVEEEEIRKRSPSPSISSTSTTSTTDSDSTFVRGEELCPTTSSMSNLVDVMACSSPHEKLIVDLRDSLFMLLHGRNKTKEMPIGTLQEREMTAAQILFWVANLALHSFDEMENPLSSLSYLSPHIVLFSEHMVICIVMHSDFSSDDSDSSSISSLTVVSSSSNVSVMSERFTDSPPPSSAFEDDDDIRKECLRWKAPELQMNKKMGATKESVVFSIGMMLWECLTLEIPFDEYEGEVAGQKIVNHERPNMSAVKESNFFEIIRACLSAQPEDRLSLAGLKREFIQRFPAGAAILTMSDAIDLEETTEDGEHMTSVNSSDITGTLLTEK